MRIYVGIIVVEINSLMKAISKRKTYVLKIMF